MIIYKYWIQVICVSMASISDLTDKWILLIFGNWATNTPSQFSK